MGVFFNALKGGDELGIFRDVFKRNLEIRDMLDLDLASDPATRSYLKRIALETNINFIAQIGRAHV